VLVIATFTSAHAQRTIVTSGVVLNGVTIVDTHTGALKTNQAIAIDGGKIVKIVNAGSLATSGTAKLVDAHGKYVVPGFLDMHAHAVDTANLHPSFFPLLIANGVTGFREESVTPANIELGKKVNEDSASGRIDAPEVIFSGTEMHLKPNLSAMESSNAAWPSMDHLGAGVGLIMDCSTDEQAVRADYLIKLLKPPFPPNYVLNPRAFDSAATADIYQRVLDTYSESKCVALSRVFAKNHTRQTLTLIRLRTQDWGNDPVYRDDPNLKYLDKATVAVWDKLGDQFATLSPGVVNTLRNYYGLQKSVTKLMQRNGVPILAGSDVGGVWLIPGFSLHQEFHQLADAGLTPLEVLQATTLNPAEFLNRQTTMGTVDEGKNADLVLLDSNPIADVSSLDKISGVVLRGKYFSKEAIERMKSDIAAAYK
jgi:Amidohydrolase family